MVVPSENVELLDATHHDARHATGQRHPGALDARHSCEQTQEEVHDAETAGPGDARAEPQVHAGASTAPTGRLFRVDGAADVGPGS